MLLPGPCAAAAAQQGAQEAWRGKRRPPARTCSPVTRTPSQSESCRALCSSVHPPPLVRKASGYRGTSPPLLYSLAIALR